MDSAQLKAMAAQLSRVQQGMLANAPPVPSMPYPPAGLSSLGPPTDAMQPTMMYPPDAGTQQVQQYLTPEIANQINARMQQVGAPAPAYQLMGGAR